MEYVGFEALVLTLISIIGVYFIVKAYVKGKSKYHFIVLKIVAIVLIVMALLEYFFRK